jgi:hypothetical protein
MSALAKIPTSRVAPLVRLLGSPIDAEALGAARAIDRTLKAAGADLHALADHIEHGGGTWRTRWYDEQRRAEQNPSTPSIERSGHDRARIFKGVRLKPKPQTNQFKDA